MPAPQPRSDAAAAPASEGASRGSVSPGGPAATPGGPATTTARTAATPGGPAETPGRAASPAGAAASTLRRSILLHLRQSGPSSPDALAAALFASRTGVLQQLHALEAANLVRHSTERHGVGRPRHLYDVTPDAQGLFPADYDGLAAGLLAAIADVGGPDLIEDVFAARRRQISHRLQQKLATRLPAHAGLADRVRELAVLQDEAGYLADWYVGEDGALRLRENNCAIHRVARETRAACDAELRLFRELLGEDVVRESHIVSGDRCCTYRIGSPRD
jgi:predicted ArsR family transcriptional regulator